MTVPVLRFAPSPNGYLHLGHAFSALANYELARLMGGRLLLRLEDIDVSRCRPQYETAIYEDLAWLGIQWDTPVRRQSEHFDAYLDALEKLELRGLIFASFESRTEMQRLVESREVTGAWPRDPDGAPLYPGNGRMLSREERNRRLDTGDPYALRLATDIAVAQAGPLEWGEVGSGPQGETGTVHAMPQAWGDVVLARKETPTSYHLAVVIDDALQGVTHVVRGQDLFWSTSVHCLLQRLLGLPTPVYQHHKLIMGADGRKLAKSTRATSLRELRAAGVTPADIRRGVGLA